MELTFEQRKARSAEIRLKVEEHRNAILDLLAEDAALWGVSKSECSDAREEVKRRLLANEGFFNIVNWYRQSMGCGLGEAHQTVTHIQQGLKTTIVSAGVRPYPE